MHWYDTRLAGARAVFTDRDLGNLALHVADDEADVRRRRRLLADSLGMPSGEILFLDQVHGTHVVDADSVGPGEIPTGDAAVSVEGRALAVMVADCVPVVLAAPAQYPEAAPVTAVAHAGRRGLLDGVLQAVVQEMRRRTTGRIQALIGPSVCGSCYEVPEEMARAAELALPGVRSTTSWGTPGLDLPGAAQRILAGLEVDVRLLDVESSPRCTLENTRLSSHRRDPDSGRIAGVVWGAADAARP